MIKCHSCALLYNANIVTTKTSYIYTIHSSNTDSKQKKEYQTQYTKTSKHKTIDFDNTLFIHLQFDE